MENFNMDYYKYWEEFVAQWYNNTNNAIMGWTNPDKEPAPLCNTNGGEKSSLYIPEPWWGNDGKQPLHSVVINFNPGEGGPQQERENIHNRKLYNGSYADDIVNYAGETGKKGDSWPDNTAYWHYIYRARPVHNTLGLKPSLKSHLSVELIPWHTINVNKETHYRLYLEQNIKAVYEYSICFAAQESKRIANDYLKNVVLLKMSGDFTRALLDKLKSKELVDWEPIGNIIEIGNGRYMEFTLNTWPGIRFISIWGASTQNKFPVSQMEAIFKKLGILP